MTGALQTIISEIGELSDRAEADRWRVAEAIADAYRELPSYTRGLTAGLCVRLRRSTDSIYAMRDAWELKSKLRDASDLSISHFAALAHLAERYNISDDSLREWVEWVQETNASVREMSTEIATRHTLDERKAFFRRAERIGKLMLTILQDAESVGMPEELRIQTRAVVSVLQDWQDKLTAWKNMV